MSPAELLFRLTSSDRAFSDHLFHQSIPFSLALTSRAFYTGRCCSKSACMNIAMPDASNIFLTRSRVAPVPVYSTR
jgi:hypothetical protein